jgi:ABC-2 type transport system ATP-binding protein
MITIENLTKFYGDLCALDHINFEIKKGEVLGLLGPNGAGKSTCMRILTCFLNPTSGNIKVGELNVLEDSIEVKKKLGYLPENAPLYPDMLVFDYLDYVADTRDLSAERKEERIQYLAGICGIKEVMHKAIGELSKGYKQRVGLAQAMMGDPEILVLDEPTSGLDPNQIIEIREIIKEIGKEKTVILSTHILSEAEATCDRVVIINKGKIVADGDVQSLQKSMGSGTDVHITLTGADFNGARDVLVSIEGVREVARKESNDGSLALLLNCDKTDSLMEDIYKAIKAKDWILVEFVQSARTLENIFRELTKEN